MLLALGVSHKTAPIEVREQLAFVPDHIPYALESALAIQSVNEAALLSTCNRTEIYFGLNSETFDKSEYISWWKQFKAKNLPDLEKYLYFYPQQQAVLHMMRLASGLDSMVLGESEVLGQLKSAFKLSQQQGVLGSRLTRLFEHSFSLAKKVRHSTGVGVDPISIAYAAVSMARQIFTDLSKSKVCLLGAGENIELVLRHLKAKNVSEIVIVNRSLDNAKKLAQRYGAEAKSMSALTACLQESDIVISSTASPNCIITAEHINAVFKRKKQRPIFMVDLAVPRDIDPEVTSNQNVYLYSVDDLQSIVEQNFQHRRSAAQEAQQIIELEAQNFMTWLNARDKFHTLKALRAHVDDLKTEAIDKALQQLERGVPAEEVINLLAHQLTQKILHQPTIALKRATLNSEYDKILLANKLFKLD